MIRAAYWSNGTESWPLVLKLWFTVLERLPLLILDPARGPAGLWAPDNAHDRGAPADSTGVSLSCQAPQGLLSPLNADKESPFGLQIDTNCCSCCSVSKSCLTLCSPMDCSPPGSSVHRILQARTLEWVLPFPSPGDLPDPEIEPESLVLQAVSCISGGFSPD